MHWIKILSVLGVVALFSCKKDKPLCLPAVETLEGSWLVLNEGLFQQNNGSITKIGPSASENIPHFFLNQNNRPLGDTGNDMKRYGGKIYVVINASSTLEILDASNGALIKQILMISSGQAKQPRYIDFKNGKAFISCFDGFVDVLDTTSLTITNRIAVGNNPDHLRIAGDKLYVSNSGGLDFPNLDSTVSVIDINTETELQKINVGVNPGSIALGGNGDLFVISRGDFGAIPSRMHRISTTTDSKVESYSFDASQLSESNGNIAVFENVGDASIKTFNVSSNALSASELLSLANVATPYKVQFDAWSQRYFVFDGNGYVNHGFVFEYDSSGQFLSKSNAELVPTAILTF